MFVRDGNGQALVFVYSSDTEVEARQAKVLAKDEARRIAINITRLPELLVRGADHVGGSLLAFRSLRRRPDDLALSLSLSFRPDQ
jgi:hypothetical protein